MRAPARWLTPGGGAPEGARELLAAAAGPDPAARARVWSALGATTGAPLPELSPLAKGAAVKTAAAAGATTKVMIASASLVAALGAGGTAWRAAHFPVRTATTQRALTTRGVGSPRHDAHPSESVIPPAPSPAPSAREAVKPAAPAPVVAPVALTVAPPAPPLRRAVVGPWARARVIAPTVAQVPVAPPPTPTLADEIALLAAMRAASASEPARCLALAQTHTARFGDHATLAHEREAMALTALHALGRDDEARPRAEAFLRAHPTSTVAPRVRALRDTMEPPR
ncbi:MAG: hypothetical protein U0325_22880 [Polyangiales bacterium]